MNENVLLGIGIAANVVNIAYNIPLVWKPFRSRSVDNISTYFMTLRFAGITLWIIYGVLIEDLYIILLNLVSMLSSVLLLIMWCFQSFGVCGFKKQLIAPT
jgi:MtN3 and saliva related transmembrane protein